MERGFEQTGCSPYWDVAEMWLQSRGHVTSKRRFAQISETLPEGDYVIGFKDTGFSLMAVIPYLDSEYIRAKKRDLVKSFREINRAVCARYPLFSGLHEKTYILYIDSKKPERTEELKEEFIIHGFDVEFICFKSFLREVLEERIETEPEDYEKIENMLLTEPDALVDALCGHYGYEKKEMTSILCNHYGYSIKPAKTGAF